MAEIAASQWVTEYITPYDYYAHGIERVLVGGRSQYQDYAIVEGGPYGQALVLDGLWQSCTGDEFLYHEPLVHPAIIHYTLVNGRGPENVLILGGGEGATSREVLRWKSVKRCVMVDLDGEVVEACKKHLASMHQGAFDDPRHELVIGDALDTIDQSGAEWDVIISDLTDPIDEGPSFRLFTAETFANARATLRDGGVFMLQAGQTAPPLMDIHCRLIHTLTAVFDHVAPLFTPISSYGSPWGYGLGSSSPIDTRPDTDAIDALLAEHLDSELRFIDGRSYMAVLNPGKHLRDRIAAQTEPFTLGDPAKFFAKGVAGK